MYYQLRLVFGDCHGVVACGRGRARWPASQDAKEHLSRSHHVASDRPNCARHASRPPITRPKPHHQNPPSSPSRIVYTRFLCYSLEFPRNSRDTSPHSFFLSSYGLENLTSNPSNRSQFTQGFSGRAIKKAHGLQPVGLGRVLHFAAYAVRRRRQISRPKRALAKRARVPGSGTTTLAENSPA